MAPTLFYRDESHAVLPNRGPKIIGIACGFLGASLIIGIMRLSLRAKRKLMSWDDLCVVICLLFSTLQTVSACMTVKWGYGQLLRTLSKEQFRKSLFWFYICQFAYKGSIWPAKISLLLLYNRVFGDSTQQVISFGVRLRTSLTLLISFAISFWLISEFVSLFSCIPVKHYWDKSVPGKCHVNTLAWWFTQSVLNTVSDVFILVLPMPLVKELQIPKQQKISLMLVFALGLFVTICTIIRMTTFKTGARGADPTYDGAVTLIWSLIETNVSIICACLPLLRPLISHIIPSFGKSRSRSKGISNSNSYNLENCHHSNGGRSRLDSNHHHGHDDHGLSTTRTESWDWIKDHSEISARKTTIEFSKSHHDFCQLGCQHFHHGNHRNCDGSQYNKDSSFLGKTGGSGGGGGGITKHTNVEITTETASDDGSQRRLTLSGGSKGVGFSADVEGGGGGSDRERDRDRDQDREPSL